MKFSLVIFAALVTLAFAKCTRYKVEVNNSADLTKALKEARPGAKISLAHGVYKGSWTVSVKGEKSSNCDIVIDGHNKASFVGDGKYALRFKETEYVTLTGIIINETSESGIEIEDSKYVSLYDNVFTYIGDKALVIKNGEYNEVENCHFSYIKDSSVVVDGGKWNEITECSFGEGLSGEVFRVESGTLNTTVRENEFIANNGSFTYWMHVLGDYSYVRDNDFHIKSNSNIAEGILTEGTGNYYRMNSFTFSGNDKYAIYNQGTDEKICLSNTVQGGPSETNGPYEKDC